MALNVRLFVTKWLPLLWPPSLEGSRLGPVLQLSNSGVTWGDSATSLVQWKFRPWPIWVSVFLQSDLSRVGDPPQKKREKKGGFPAESAFQTALIRGSLKKDEPPMSSSLGSVTIAFREATGHLRFVGWCKLFASLPEFPTFVTLLGLDHTWTFRGSQILGVGQKTRVFCLLCEKMLLGRNKNTGGHVCLRRGRECLPVDWSGTFAC